MKPLLLTILYVAIFSTCLVSAQAPAGAQACSDTPPPPVNGNNGCAPGLNLAQGQFSAVPLIDGTGQSYGDPDNNKVSLYGTYGNSESAGAALAHFNQGTDQGVAIVPLCPGLSQTCPFANRRIVFLFIGFSNCDIEVCGGNSDAWDRQDHNQNQYTMNGHLKGEPCATQCPNLNNPDPNHPTAWNQVLSNGGDGVTQQSLLYQIYHPTPHLVGDHVVVFNGAYGAQTLDKWDPTLDGYYANTNDCTFPQNSDTTDPECNYNRVKSLLQTNGYAENQVQAIFIKSSDSYPQCDLKRLYCGTGLSVIPDAYQSERHLGNILRYLKCCTLDINGNSTGNPRYTNLKQVFVTTRIYGGYANGTSNGCLMPEPFAYEEGFAAQRIIVAQINRTPDNYSGNVRYPEDTPWVDWGPYLWASGPSVSTHTGLFWCNGQNSPPCNLARDVRDGDPLDSNFWGDYTHPSASGAKKVADRIVDFITNSQNPNHVWVAPWIGQ